VALQILDEIIIAVNGMEYLPKKKRGANAQIHLFKGMYILQL